MAAPQRRVRSVTTALLTAVGILVATVLVVVGGGSTAQAADPVVGTLTLTPETGADTTAMSLVSHSTSGTGCPASTSRIYARVVGPGNWAAGVDALSTTSTGFSTTADFTVPLSDTMFGLSQSNSAPIVAGKYDFTLFCQNNFGTIIYGTMTGSIWFTSPTAYQSTDPNPSTPTPTPTTPTPTPTTPTPTPPAPTAPTLVSAAAVSGTARVGSTLTCAATWSGATAVGYQWLRAGVAISGANATGYALAGPDLAQQISCRSTAANSAGMTTSTSSPVTAALGPALVNTLKPVIKGKVKVGRVLHATSGSWRPAATSYKYRWKRDGKRIKGARTATHTVVKADRHHTLTVKVIAIRVGWARGSVLSKVRSVP